MIIVLLAALGVDAGVIIVVMFLIVGRRRWLKRQPGYFRGAIRLASGSSDALSPKWRRGVGRRIRDIVIWNRAPFLFRSYLAPVDRLMEERTLRKGELKRLGDEPCVVKFAADSAVVEIAVPAEDRSRLLGLAEAG